MSFFEKLNLRNPHRLQLRRIRARDTACYLILPAKSFAANATRMTGRGEFSRLQLLFPLVAYGDSQLPNSECGNNGPVCPN